MYTEAYGQLDINASYKLTERFTVHAEVINANDGVQRLHGRSKDCLLYTSRSTSRGSWRRKVKWARSGACGTRMNGPSTAALRPEHP